MTNLRDRARELRREVTALAIASRDPRTPWYAKAVVLVTVGLAVSPIDPIPDFVPVLGYADDLLFVPAGAYLARRWIPDDALTEARAEAETRQEQGDGGAIGWLAALLVVAGWLLAGYALWRFFA
ncbi:YkvA family protein [Haladaptatus salinisoli]|uniref:YkvA family protein n=1 Tax=Haladaptatus salinisoli TaxID=2884876 RepID=UPI001D09A925|nr:YkvA family protein [Haladaptatus salinisoli]